MNAIEATLPGKITGALRAPGMAQADPIEQIDLEDRAHLTLLRLVLCTALATVALALAGALQF